ncbi:MAG: hypothetical protein ABWY05_08590 [Noviherbaspirillum sp.]
MPSARLLPAFLLALLLTASGIAGAANYTLWINGRGNSAGAVGNYNSFGYWGPAGVAAGVNNKSVNWDGYNSISSQNGKVRDALDCFCTGSNWCYIAAHDAGDLMIGYALANYGGSARLKKNAAPNSAGVCGNTDGNTQTGWNIKWVRVAGGAAGGSELSDHGAWAAPAPLARDLKTTTARAMYNHSSTRNIWFYNYAGSAGTALGNPADWFINDLTLGTTANEGGSVKWGFHSLSLRDDAEARSHYCNSNWQGIVSPVRAAMESMPDRPGPGWRALAWTSLGIVLLALLGWLALPARPLQPSPQAAAPRIAAGPASAPAPPAAAAPVEAETSAARRARLVAQKQLAEHTLCSYRQASRYPDGSRPISQHPDQVYPNAPVAERRPMRDKDGKAAPGIQIVSTQSRVYASAGESVLLGLAAADERGNPLPVTVDQATARGLANAPGRPGAGPVTLLMADDGAGGVSGVLAPAESGLAGFHGTLRAEVAYRVAGRSGMAVFDVMHTPQPPAVWPGPVREVLEDGSLHFILGARVTVPGR